MIFANDEIYHVYNRGLDNRNVFTRKKECERAIRTLDYYRFLAPTLRLSKALLLKREERENFFVKLRNSNKLVEIISYCLMPNHYHLLLRQRIDKGISKFISNFTNSYTRYFNLRNNKRLGNLFRGVFRAVHIENDDQLLHVHRYIHINPAVSFVIKTEELEIYPWSSLREYLGLSSDQICEKGIIMANFRMIKSYKKFIYNQVEYGKKLSEIKHLIHE